MTSRRTTVFSTAALAALAGAAGSLHAQTLTRVSTNYANVEIPGGGTSPVLNPAGTRLLFTSDNSNTLAYNVFGYPTGHSATNLYLKNLTTGDVDLVSWTGDFSQPPQLGSEPLAINLAGNSSSATIGSNGRVAFQNFGDQDYMDGLNGVNTQCLPGSATNGYTYVYTGGGLRNDAHEGWNGSPCFGVFINASMNDPCISPEGTLVAFSTTSSVPGLNTSNGTNSDTNGVADVYVKNLSTNAFSKASIAGNALSGFTESNGASRRPSVGSNGTYVAFESDASNLGGADNNSGGPDIFVRDLSTAILPFTERISVTNANASVSGNGDSTSPSISNDGRFVAFLSESTNLVLFGSSAFRQVYVRDRTNNTTVMVSRGYDGLPATADCSSPRISADGDWIVFNTFANNIVRGDTNGFSDTFVYSVATGTTRRVSVNTPNFSNITPFQGNNNSFAGWPSDTLAGGGVKVAFQSSANNLVSGDGNSSTDVFLRTLPAIPVNDKCADATAAAAGVLYTGDTAGAAVDGTASCGSSLGSPDVWYVTNATQSGNIVATTQGSSYDTVLTAFLGCGGSELACNDDFSGTTSQISFPVTNGQTIRFRVAGYNGYFGAYHFKFSYTCGAADLGMAGGLPGSDGLLDNNDFVAFINYFFASDPHADVGIAGGLAGSDGLYDNNDFIAFINLFFAGC